MLIAFLALLAAANGLLGWTASTLFGIDGLSIQILLGYVSMNGKFLVLNINMWYIFTIN